MLCPAARAPRAAGTTQAEPRGGRFKQPGGEEGPRLSKGLSVGTRGRGGGGTPQEPADTHGSNPLQLAIEKLTEGM